MALGSLIAAGAILALRPMRIHESWLCGSRLRSGVE
jgi:hypothetical protein